MSRTAVIVALVIVLVLGGVALLLSKGGTAPTTPTGPLLSFDPARTTEVRVDFPDGRVQSVQREPSGDWRITLGGAGKAERSWPASTTQVHAALRILSTLASERPGDGDIKSPAGTLRITVEGGPPQVLRFSPQKLGGRVLVESVGPPARMGWIDAQVSDMLVATGPQAWRSPAALPGVGTEASRITLRSHDGAALKLARIQGKWALREPLAAPADSDAVAKLLAILAAVRITDFCDRGPPAQTGLDAPVASLAIETDSRDASGASKATILSLTVGQAADIAGKTVVAKLERAGDGRGYSEVMIVSGEELAAISSDPVSYLARQALDVAPTDVGRVVITRFPGSPEATTAAYAKSLDAWEEERSTGKVPAGVADVKAIAATLDLLSTTAAEKVTLIQGESTDKPIAAIELATAGGAPLGSVTVTIQGTKVILTGAKIRREYPAGVGATVAEWLGRR